jgi:hypothetical protein
MALPVAESRPIRDVVHELVHDARRYFPEERTAPTVRAMTVTARPLSDLGRVELSFDGTVRVMYVKVPRRTPATILGPAERKARVEFETLRSLYEGFATRPGYAVVKPIAFFAQHGAVVTEAGQGANLYAVLKAKAVLWRPFPDLATLEDYSRRCGVWLAHFQALTRRPSTESMSWEAVLERFRGDVRKCVAAGFSAAEGKRLTEAFQRQIASVRGTTVDMAGMHPDFQPDNVLVSSEGVTVLDFASFQHGPVWSDPARFAVTVAFLARLPGYPKARMDRLVGAFFDGYGVSSANGPGMSLYALRSLVRVAAGACRPSTSPLGGIRRRWAIRYLGTWPQVVDSIARLAGGPQTITEPREPSTMAPWSRNGLEKPGLTG